MRYSFVFLFSICIECADSQTEFITVRDGILYHKGSNYSFIGVNYWYGGFIASDSLNNGKQRLKKELDFLKSKKITNLRVMISAEGDNSYPYRIYPSIQIGPRMYNERLMEGFDFFLVEAAKRNMKIVFVLNNNWEWSGGFGQYLEWADYINPILPKTASWDWDKYCDYISKFYLCDSCQVWYRDWIKYVLTRKNTISGKIYKNDPTIMAWELANEPRPMKHRAKEGFKKWIRSTSAYIKSQDDNHLVTIGVEGIIGTLMDSILFKEIHLYPTIDYATIHIWPKTWQWYNGQSSHSTSDTTLFKTKSYIESHAQWARDINKPLVIEEFGLHRDGNVFEEHSATTHRDAYFEYIFKIGRENKVAGYNFWGAFAIARRDHDPSYGHGSSPVFWEEGMPYSADPPQEEQGLYGVYMSDSSTWKIIK